MRRRPPYSVGLVGCTECSDERDMAWTANLFFFLFYRNLVVELLRKTPEIQIFVFASMCVQCIREHIHYKWQNKQYDLDAARGRGIYNNYLTCFNDFD